MVSESVKGFDLNASGFADAHPDGNEIKQFEVATAAAWISACTRKLKTKWYWGTSYGLKHEAERWGRSNGMSPYVSNGAFIKAAILAGYEVRQLKTTGRQPSLNAQLKLGFAK
jgi:hypothetical protein